MAHQNAYDTHILSKYDIEKLKPDLDIAKTADQTWEMGENLRYVIETASIAPFPAPIYHNGIVYVDARPFTTLERDGSLRIKDMVEHRLRLEQAQLELIWIEKPVSHENLTEQLRYHREILAKWISDSINFSYGLNPYQSVQMLALASLFTIGQFYNNVDDPTAFRLQETLAKQFYINHSVYETITTDTERLFPRDIEEFIQAVSMSQITPRLVDFKAVSLISLLSKSFWGVSNDTLLCTLAIEYPPALLAIIRTCIDNTAYKRSKIGKLVDGNKSKNAHESFVRAYDTLIMRSGSELRPDVMATKIPRNR